MWLQMKQQKVPRTLLFSSIHCFVNFYRWLPDTEMSNVIGLTTIDVSLQKDCQSIITQKEHVDINLILRYFKFRKYCLNAMLQSFLQDK